jgi:hypothetical protein
MPQSSLPAADRGLPISRKQVEAQISRLIDLLDALDATPTLNRTQTLKTARIPSRPLDGAPALNTKFRMVGAFI